MAMPPQFKRGLSVVTSNKFWNFPKNAKITIFGLIMVNNWSMIVVIIIFNRTYVKVSVHVAKAMCTGCARSLATGTIFFMFEYVLCARGLATHMCAWVCHAHVYSIQNRVLTWPFLDLSRINMSWLDQCWLWLTPSPPVSKCQNLVDPPSPQSGWRHKWTAP